MTNEQIENVLKALSPIQNELIDNITKSGYDWSSVNKNNSTEVETYWNIYKLVKNLSKLHENENNA